MKQPRKKKKSKKKGFSSGGTFYRGEVRDIDAVGPKAKQTIIEINSPLKCGESENLKECLGKAIRQVD